MSSKKPRHERARIKYKFADGGEMTVGLVEQTIQGILCYARQAISDDPVLRSAGLGKIKTVAEFCVAGQFYLNDQAGKAGGSRGTIEIDEGRTSMTNIIRNLARERDELGDYLKPRELWPRFAAALDALGLDPCEDKLGWNFDGGRVTKDSFRATLSRERKKTKSET